MKKTAVKLVALVATALLLLSGCGTSSAGVAATVGAKQISVAQVDAVARVIAANSPDSPDWGKWRSSVVQVMVISQLGAVVEQQAGVTVPELQRQQVYAQNDLYKALAKDPASADFMSGFADVTVLLSSSKYQPLFTTVVGQVPVKVNPVFGEWDASKAQLTGQTGSLSKALS
jgi:hypothetical protein